MTEIEKERSRCAQIVERATKRLREDAREMKSTQALSPDVIETIAHEYDVAAARIRDGVAVVDS